MKKIIAMILSFAMMLSLTVVWLSADPGYSVDGVLSVSDNQAVLDVSVTVPDTANLAGIQVDVAYNAAKLTLNENGAAFNATGVISSWANTLVEKTAAVRFQSFTTAPTAETVLNNGTASLARLSFTVADGAELADGDVTITVVDAADIDAATINDKFETTVTIQREIFEGYSVDGIVAAPSEGATCMDISVTVPGGADLAGIMIDVAYNTEKLSVGAADMSVADNVIAGWAKDVLDRGNGIYRIQAFTAAPTAANVLNNGTAKLAVLPFTVIGDAELTDGDIVITIADAANISERTIADRFTSSVKLTPVVIDKTELEDAISEAEALVPSAYTADSYGKVISALNTAKEVFSNPDAKQSQINAAETALRDAIAALAPAQTRDGYEVKGIVSYPDNGAARMDVSVTVPADAALAGVQFDVIYNTAKLTAAAFDAATADGVLSGWTVDSLDKGNGAFRIQSFTAAPESSTVLNGTAKLGSVVFTVADGAELSDGDVVILVKDAATLDAATISDYFSTSVTFTPKEVVDKTALEDLIAQAKALNSEEYTEDSFAAVANALAAAETVYADDDATQEAVNDAVALLSSAIDNLVKVPSQTVDKSALNEVIAKAKALNSEEYTEDSFAAVANALAAAETVYADDDATQEAVNDAVALLSSAIDSLVKVSSQTVDKSALNEVIAKAEALNKSDYTADSYQAVADALSAAKAIAADDGAAQEAVDAATKALNDAMNALQKNVAPTPTTPAPAEPENPATSDSGLTVYAVFAVISVVAAAVFVAMKKKRI